MNSSWSWRPFAVALLLGGAIGATAVAVQAGQADQALPAAKRAAIAGATTIGPADINTQPVNRYLPAARDEGTATQVAQVREAVVRLYGDYYDLGSAPRDLAARHEQIAGARGKADRAAALARVWDPSTYTDELSAIEAGFATLDGDTTTVGYSKATFVVTSWQQVRVKGNAAEVVATGYITYDDNDGSTHSDDIKQWRLGLVRGGGPDNYHGWRIATRAAAELPEGVTK